MAGGKRQPTPGTLIAFVVGQSTSQLSLQGAVPLKLVKSAPAYSGQLPPYRILRRGRLQVDGRPVEFQVKAFLPEQLVVELTAPVRNIFGANVLPFKDALITAANHILQKLPLVSGFSEEYTLYCVAGYRGNPQQFLSHGSAIVSLLKSEGVPLSVAEISKTIDESSLQYAKDDLIIVDWDGAFIFDQHGDWQDAVQLLEVANTHLLRLRVLDARLDQRSAKMLSQFEKLTTISPRQARRMITDLMRLRSESIREFEHAERDIQLIGDWFAAKLYGLAKRKFSLDRWRTSIREELDSLQEMSGMAAEHFSVTTERRAEQVQQILWYIQLVGWFVLLFFEWRMFRN